jgi:predicted ATPase/class 3 adenylate cyclase
VWRLRVSLAVGCEYVVVPTGSGGWYPRSFLLTDIVGSVALWERDAEAMSEAVTRHDEIVAGEVAACDGELVRTKGEGDSTFSVFAHPGQAVAAAAAVHGAIAAEQWRTGLGLKVRAGVHTGDAEPREGDWYGPAVNRTARLRSLATGGQTLVSGVTAGLVADQLPAGVRLLYRGRRALRGIERPEEVWELVRPDDPRLAAPSSARPGGLPVALTRFVGQRGDLERLVDLVEGERLVTLTGPGGSGKTRMVIEVASIATRRGELVWVAQLAPLRDGGLVAQAVATAVGVEDGSDPLAGLVARCEGLIGVLVLDNCEHLLDACTALIGRLLAAAPDLHVLATSREPLGVTGERVWPVRPLEVPDSSVRDREELTGVESVQLLLDRARSVWPDVRVGPDDVTAVVRICRALDGIPLAIELAAGRLRSLSLADLAARLDDQLQVLTGARPARDHPRHQTLRMTLDWSYDLLTDEQQALARRLSVFAGGFRLDAIQAVCGGTQVEVLDAVDELVAKSLVSFDPATARYRLLEPLRQYLAQRLEQAAEAGTIQRAHAYWVARLCERLGARLLDDQRAHSRRLREETGNIDLALRWALDHDHAPAFRIVGALGHYWYFRDQVSGRRWCGPVVDAATGVAPRTRAQALLTAGIVAQYDHDWEVAVIRLREALAIFRAEDAAAGQATSLFVLGLTLASPWNPEHRAHQAEAARCFEESLQVYARLANWVGVGWCRILLSEQALSDEHLERSEHLAEQVVDECTAAGARHPVARALSVLAFIAHRRGRDQAALELLQDATAISRELDDPIQLAFVLGNLAAQQTTMGRGAEALQSLAEAAQLDEQIGRVAGWSRPLAAAAVVHLARGKPAIATRALGAYDAHTPPDAIGRPGDASWYVGILSDASEATRARLDPTEVAAAAKAARRKSPDQLINELIVQVANE